MPSRQEIRSEETKRAILTAAGELFSKRGFDAVTMREIAKLAGCSHTTIYIYFKDKEALLHQLSMGPLQFLQKRMESVLSNKELPPEARLNSMAREFIEFCLTNRNMYTIFFMTQATRVDEEEPTLEINKLRNQLFGLLREAIGECLGLDDMDGSVLAAARIFFFTLHGILNTYNDPEEPADMLIERLKPTFDLAVKVLIEGCKQVVKRGAESHED